MLQLIRHVSPQSIESCPGCKFMFATNDYYYGGGENTTTVANIPEGVVKEYYTAVISSTCKNYFIGFTESNGKIDRAFACGIKGTDYLNMKSKIQV